MCIRRMKSIVLLLLFIMCTMSVFAQIDPHISCFVKVSENIYKITADLISYKVNFVMSVGEDGVLLVDTGTKDAAEELLEKILALGKGTPKIVINSHVHGDHTNGNAILGKDAVIIAHREVTKNLLTRNLVAEMSEDALPDIDFVDSLSVYFNGEKINLVAFPGSHSSSDIIIYFTKSKIAYLGDLGYGLQFPSTDVTSGDNTKYVEVIKNVLDYLPKDTKLIVSGHGQDLTLDDYKKFYEMIQKTTAIVHDAYEKGKDADTMIKENILAGWESFSFDGYQTTEGWIRGVVNDFAGIKGKPYMSNPLYVALKEGGVKAAIDKFNDIMKNHPDEYSYPEIALYWIGDYLLRKNRNDETIEFCKFAMEKYPEQNLFYDIMGEACYRNGDNKKAVKFLIKAVQLNPENYHSARLLEEAQKK